MRFSVSRVVLVMAFVMLILPIAPASAAAITVSGNCSLAEAIQNANDDAQTNSDCAAGSGADTITISSAITLTAALPQITTQMTITGASIDGDDKYQVLYVASGGNLTLSSITIRDGRANRGGGLYVTSGGQADLISANFTDNENLRPGSAVRIGGGAIYNAGTLAISSGTFTGNESTKNREPESANGGVIWNHNGTLTVSDGTYRGNTAQWCGAISNSHGGTMALNNNAFIDNVGTKGCGAIGSQQVSGESTISNSTFNGNSTVGDGGAITGGNNAHVLAITNNVFSNNRARNGGAIHNFHGHFVVVGNTFTNNSATQRGGAINDTVLEAPDGTPRGVILDDPNTNTFSGNTPQSCINVDCGDGLIVSGNNPPPDSGSKREDDGDGDSEPTEEPKESHEDAARRHRDELKDEHDIEVSSDVEPVNAIHYGQGEINHPGLTLGYLNAVDLYGWINEHHPATICFPEKHGFLMVIKKGVPETLHGLGVYYNGSQTCADLTFAGTVVLLPNCPKCEALWQQYGGRLVSKIMVLTVLVDTEFV